MKNFPHQELTKEIIGIYYNVYNELGVMASLKKYIITL